MDLGLDVRKQIHMVLYKVNRTVCLFEFINCSTLMDFYELLYIASGVFILNAIIWRMPNKLDVIGIQIFLTVPQLIKIEHSFCFC